MPDHQHRPDGEDAEGEDTAVTAVLELLPGQTDLECRGSSAVSRFRKTLSEVLLCGTAQISSTSHPVRDHFFRGCEREERVVSTFP